MSVPDRPPDVPDATRLASVRSERSDLGRALVNMAAKAGSLVVEKGAQLALLLVAAPILGVVAFGRLSYALSLTALLAFGTDLGLTLWTTRALAREPALSARVLGTAFRLRLYAMVPYFVALGAVALNMGPGEARAALLAIGVASLARAFLDHARAVFRARERIGDEGKVNAVSATLATACGLAALWISGRGLPALALGMMVGTLIGAVYGFLVLGRGYGRWAGGFDRRLAGDMLRQSLPFWLAGLFSLAYSRGDVVILRALAGDAEVGAYRAAGQLFEVAKNVPIVVLTAMFPQLARDFRLSRDRLRRTELRLSLILLGTGVVAGAALSAVSGLVARRIFGPQFSHTVAALRILSLALPLAYVNGGLTHFLVARDRGSLHSILAGLMVLVNVAANFGLSARLGASGAAWSTVITEAALSLCCLFALRALRRVADATGPSDPGAPPAALSAPRVP
jgi:O-antigen/teichoic acid export membrane protein